MSPRSVEIPYEQAVYGSFPFWDKGYAVLAHSPGCRPEWLTELRAVCQRFGERPGGVPGSEVRGLFALRLARGPWMIVGVGSPGNDDRGRPGALAFHALFVSPRDYLRAGCDPFAMAGALRDAWTAETRSLPADTWTIAPPPPPAPGMPPDSQVAPLVAALTRGRRVAIESDAPIDALARQVWPALPGRVRRRASLATWAFGNGNRFDLVALPRLAGVALDASYVDLAALEGRETPPHPPTDARGKGLARALLPIAGGAGAALLLLAAMLIGRVWHRAGTVTHTSPDPPAAVDAATTVPATAPDRSAYRDDPRDLDERRRVAEALLALSERFGVLEPGAAVAADDPTALMVMLADRLRYRGPSLTTAELTRLAAEPDHDHEHALALRWHAQMRRFADDRRLPARFAAGTLRWQLATLAWSFHLDDDLAGGRRSTAETPHALGEALAVDVPLPPIGLSARYPALAAYRDFLGRLPRR